MNRKMSAAGAIKSNEKDAHLFVRILTVMVNMLTLMKTETMGMFFRLDIKNDPGNRVGSETTKGALVEIQFNSKLVEMLVRLTSAAKAKFHSGRKSRRKMSTDTDDEPTSASDETPNWDDVPFVAFIVRQVNRILAAPKYICSVEGSEYFGECYFKAAFEAGKITIQIQDWARGERIATGSSKTGFKKRWTNKHWNHGHQPFLRINHATYNELIRSGQKARTTTPRGKVLETEEDARKYNQGKKDRMLYMNAALAVQTILKFTPEKGFVKEGHGHPVGYYIESGKAPNRHTRVVGYIYANEDTRFRVKGLKEDQLETVYTYPNHFGGDRESNGRDAAFFLRDSVLGEKKRNGGRGASSIKFGDKSSKKKEVIAHFQQPAKELFKKGKGGKFVLTQETVEYVFNTDICGGKYRTIATQLKLRQRRESTVTLGDALLGSERGMFWKMLMSIGPFSSTPTPEHKVREGFGQLNPKFADGVRTVPRRSKENDKGWTERGLLNSKVSWKAGAIGPRACGNACECFLCQGNEISDELNGLFDEDLRRLTGLGNYDAPTLIPVMSRDDVPVLKYGTAGNPDDDAEQAMMLNTMNAHFDTDTFPMWIEAEQWNAKQGFTIGAQLISRPATPADTGRPGHRLGSDEIEFVELVAYPTHIE